MSGIADFASRVLAYLLACLLAGTVCGLLSLALPGSSAGGADNILLMWGVFVFYVTLVGTPFALLVLFLLHATGRTGWSWMMAGGAAAGILPMLLLAVVLEDLPEAPFVFATILGLSGAAGGVAYHAATSRMAVAR